METEIDIATKLKEDWKEEKIKFRNELSSLKKSMANYKEERKQDWKSFKKQFNDNLEKVEKSYIKLTKRNKK